MLWMIGCAVLRPGGAEQVAYLESIEPLLVENSVLSEEVLGLAADVYNGHPAPSDLVGAWRQDVVPLAEHLHAQAVLVKPPDSFIERHKELVEVWAARATVYRDLSEAIVLSDFDAWTSARGRANEVKLREEEWFRTINAEFGTNGLVVDQFP